LVFALLIREFGGDRAVTDDLPMTTPEKKPRRFAATDPARRRAIASMGAKAAHAQGAAAGFIASEEARQAGRKGSKAAHARGTGHRSTIDEARAVGGQEQG
jgi:hypothetical protein